MINKKNNYYNNIYKEDEQQFITLKPEIQTKANQNITQFNNYSMNEQFSNNIFNPNYIYKIQENNIINSNEYIQIEDDSNEPYIDYSIDNKHLKNKSNNINITDEISNNNKIKNYYLQSAGNNISNISTRNINKNYILSNYTKKNKTFNQRKKSFDNIKISKINNFKNNKKINKTQKNSFILNNNKIDKNLFENKKLNHKKKGISLSAKKGINKKNSKNLNNSRLNKKLVNELNMNINDNIENKFGLIKNIILELDSQNFNKKAKNFLIDKINELQSNYLSRFYLLEKKYKNEIEEKNQIIKNLQNENSELKKKVSKIKSIV